MKNKILIIFAHPRFERSSNNSALIRNIPDLPEITFNDLYEKYPDFNIDKEYEQKLLQENRIIIWQHPFYWYSSPALLKQWIDIVLEFGWAYGPGGTALEGKIIFNAITAGGQVKAYVREGRNRYTVNELLVPFDQTAYLCKMIYLPPFAVHGTHRLSKDEVEIYAQQYGLILNMLVNNEFEIDEIKRYQYLNDWLINMQNKTI